MIQSYELCDLDIIGHQFTWERGRNTSHWTEVRMDRVLANPSWVDIFHTAKLYNMEGSPSDHSPLLLIPEVAHKGVRKRHFKFENAWLTEPMCFQIVKSYWEEEDNSNVLQKLKCCAESLNIWGQKITGCFSRRIKDCKVKLKVLRSKRDEHSATEYEKVKKQLFLILNQKEIFWRQRSKQLWLQAGEKNTKYFHASCNRRKRNNYIQRSKNDAGEWVEWDSGIPVMIKEYFQKLFAKDHCQEEAVLDCVLKHISDQQNGVLLQTVTPDEIKEAAFHMHPDKAPGPDDMTPAFFTEKLECIRK